MLKTKSTLKRMLAILLVFAMLLTAFPPIALANDGPFRVNFHPNGGVQLLGQDHRYTSGPVGQQTAGLPIAPTLESFSFLSWNTEPDGTGETFTANTVVTENMTVYAF